MEQQNGFTLPEDWCEFEHPHSECDLDHARIQAELDVELHPDHPFHGRKLMVMAHALSNDDVLCAHTDESGRYSIIHLTWRGGPELGACPTIDFDGDRNEVCRYFGFVSDVLDRIAEDERLGLREPMTATGTPSQPVMIRYSEQGDAE
ncbi:hypothetical protein KEC55_29990 [Burkholderia cepacia]|uniref:hypothetical protein n=1 Tax=Burkholderia cepacia TaxID=292 RepID=UPI00249E8941|nr:hypothetical protein [Burkholderia cepacia]WGY71227.1 hypothetical protein KEC55_29990 [Burkholderia cepacia]